MIPLFAPCRAVMNVVIVWVRDRVKSAREITSSEVLQLHREPTYTTKCIIDHHLLRGTNQVNNHLLVQLPIVKLHCTAVSLSFTAFSYLATWWWSSNEVNARSSNRQLKWLAPIRKQYSIWVWNDLRVKLLPIRVAVSLSTAIHLLYHYPLSTASLSVVSLAISYYMAGNCRGQPATAAQSYFSMHFTTYMVVIRAHSYPSYLSKSVSQSVHQVIRWTIPVAI